MNLHRRRESAPPISNRIAPSSPSNVQDEAYLDALSRFNDWRVQQRNSDLLASATGKKGRPIPSVIEEEPSGHDSEEGTQTDVSTDLDERKVNGRRFEVPKSPRYARHRNQPEAAPKKPRRSVEFYRNINRLPESNVQNLNNCTAAIEKNHSSSETSRYSLPAHFTAERLSRLQKRAKQLPKPNNTIYENEVSEFEKAHLKSIREDTKYAVDSPPVQFYKENSIPYGDCTPKKQINLKLRGRNFKDKPAPAPPTGVASCPSKLRQYSDSDSPFTGSYRKYELNSSSAYDEHVISSRAYKGKMRPMDKGSATMKERQQKSLSYQTIVNKHGDLVDYALPFSDTTCETPSELNSSKPEGDTLQEIRKCEELINENFQFLNSDINRTNMMDDTTSIITEPISVLKERSPQIVTDLDRSNGSTLKDLEENHQLNEVDLAMHEPQDILLELDSLEQWSKSIQISDDYLQKQFSEKNMLEYFRQTVGHNLPSCYPNEVRYRVGSLRSSCAAPLEFSCGTFRGVTVTLRKYSLSMDRSLFFAEEACKRDFEILSQVRHPTMVTLMAVSYDAGLNQATLLLEPFDFTLFDYIHKMNKRLSLLHAITVVQQISSAVCYLQECGYIHSNVSSGCVLMRKYPYAVKLTSFELTTTVSDAVRKEIENRYGSTSSSRNSMTSSQNEELKKITTYSRLIKNDEQFLRDKYRKLSKEICEMRRGQSGTLVGDGSGYDCRASRFLPYCKEYREKFTLFYYVAPELLVPKSSFVFPTRSTDVYSITLLLWEILNGYIPFAVYNRQELEKLHISRDLQLPMFERERCERFRQIFDTGLGDLGDRKMTVSNVCDLLDCLLLEMGTEKSGANDWFAEDFEEEINTSEIRKKNELNDIRKQSTFIEKTDKIYFNAEEDDPKRSKPQPRKPARKINRHTTEQQNSGSKQAKKEPRDHGSFGLSNSSVYQTIFDFNNKFLSPKGAKEATYDRTSTVKKHKKPIRAGNKAVKELFEVSIDRSPLNKRIMEQPLENPDVQANASEKSEIILNVPLSVDERTHRSPLETSKSCDSSPGARRRSITPKLNNSFRFTIGDFTLPDTPIARKNKIRKHAWLSDQKLKIGDEYTLSPLTPEERHSRSFFNDLDAGGSLQDIQPKKINISVNIIKRPIEDGDAVPKASGIFESTLWKKEKNICENSQLKQALEEEETGETGEDCNADDSVPVIIEHLTSVRDAIHKIESTFEKTGFDYSPNRRTDMGSKKTTPEVTRRTPGNESQVVAENLLIPTKILELEKTLEITDSSPPVEPEVAVTRLDVVLSNSGKPKDDQRRPQPFNPNSQLFLRRKAINTGNVIQQTVYRESIVSSADVPVAPQIPTTTSARKKKLTTRVTVNMRKISRRASDISPVTSRPSSMNLDDDQPSSGGLTPTSGTGQSVRHSCGNELYHAFSKLRLVPATDNGQGSAKSDATAPERRAVTPVRLSNRSDRFVCCNCGNAMVPADSWTVPAGSRLGMAAAFGDLNFPRESLASMFEPPLTPSSAAALTAGRYHVMAPFQKSTEDIYIDDDFCQGLGANMELVEQLDENVFLDELGYDIYATEIYHAEEEEEEEELEDKFGQSHGVAGQRTQEDEEELRFLDKCAVLNSESLGAEFATLATPIDSHPVTPDIGDHRRQF